jgi:hypothetical protein
VQKEDHLKEFTCTPGKRNVLVIIFPCEAKHESVQGDAQVLHVICKHFLSQKSSSRVFLALILMCFNGIIKIPLWLDNSLAFGKDGELITCHNYQVLFQYERCNFTESPCTGCYDSKLIIPSIMTNEMFYSVNQFI